jgi:DNA-binding MarR family transcriptional regulator
VKQPTPALSKYARGQYAVCARCGCRPCACADSAPGDELRGQEPATAAAPALNVVGELRRRSGNAIPFDAFDRYELPATERLVLLYLCRLTIGYGRQSGDLLSLPQLAERTGLSLATVKRALNGLERRGLVARSRRYERASRERGTTHIQVTLRDEVGSHRADQVGSHRADGRSTQSRRSAHSEPYLKGSPKSSPKEIQAPARSRRPDGAHSPRWSQLRLEGIDV